jgi:Protein of unknown function (DUF2934)
MKENPEAEDSEDMDPREEDSPRMRGAARQPVTWERIAERAHEISQSDQAGTDEENWLRAERELREEQEQQEG